MRVQDRQARDPGTSVSSPAIAIERLTKKFVGKDGRTAEVLTEIDLHVPQGEFVSIVGPSGCGKTTLVKIVAGLVPYEGGRVIRNGAPVSGPSRDVAMVFQTPELVPWRTTLGNTLLGAELAGYPARQFRRRADELLALVGLTDHLTKYPHELSGGMQQRTAIARALLLEPSILLMDEPFGALDALTREQLNVELQRIWAQSGCTVMFVTHSIPEAVLLSDRVVVMSKGPAARIVEDVRVTFDRPRLLELMGEGEFGHLANRVRGSLQV